MTAELSTGVGSPKSGKKPPRHPWDWYVEQAWVTHRLIDVVDLEWHVTCVDPFAGLCTIPQVLADRGFTAFGTDKFRRVPMDHPLFLNEHDFLGPQLGLIDAWHPLSIVMNPPFSCQDGELVRGLAERCVKRALAVASHKVCALLPLKWLASSGRCDFFTSFPPSVYVLSERPSMPPGDQIADLGTAAWKRGKIDYAWYVWDKNAPRLPHAQTFWIPPRPKLVKALELAEAA